MREDFASLLAPLLLKWPGPRLYLVLLASATSSEATEWAALHSCATLMKFLHTQAGRHT
jgi:hypothetical protein